MNIVDYYINTIDDMRIEMDFFYHCIVFEYIHGSVVFLVELFSDTFEFDVLNNNICLYLMDYYNFILLVYLID